MLGGCLSGNANYRNSSVVEFLYPDTDQVQVAAQQTTLSLPLRVGIAFTPSNYQGGGALTEKARLELLESVGDHFTALDFVKNVEAIPSSYLRAKGGFDNLDQLKRLFNVDVIALLSYDQNQFTDESVASIAYWTIIGAYIIPAEKNSTHTLIDAVVFDIDSRKLLFRAPGSSSLKSSATLIANDQQTREDAHASFEQAAQDLVLNLKEELEVFKEAVKEDKTAIQIAHRDEYKGSGGSDPIFILLALPGIALYFLRRRRLQS